MTRSFRFLISRSSFFFFLSGQVDNFFLSRAVSTQLIFRDRHIHETIWQTIIVGQFARQLDGRVPRERNLPSPLAMAASALDLLAFMALRRDAFTI